MRDLYHRLGIEPYATEDKVRGAIASSKLDPSLRADAQRVLLIPRHRQGYDRAHRLLTTVGQLRTRLDLQLRPFWARSGNQDFTAPGHTAHTNPIAVVQSLGEKPHRHGHRLMRWALAIAGIAAGAVYAFWRTKHR